ncbi:MAG: hypothetical protein MUD01_23045 [Chloroflexaceae bacterium]|jgi:hypothetical protein|nr:hypothetical protein [Chloroflexaceae bacterium]
MHRRYLLVGLLAAFVGGIGLLWVTLARPADYDGRIINRIYTIDNNWVRIELYNPAGFLVRNSQMVMVIGDRIYELGGFEGMGVDTVAYDLSPEEFRAVPDGALVFISYGYGRDFAFGPLNKSRLDRGPLRR